MVDIYDFNYSSQVDNKRVAYIKPIREASSQKAYKAFQIIDNIWVVPERYYWEGSLDPINKDTKQYVYDGGKYLSNDNDKNNFLLTITKLFKRLNSKPTSARLLEVLRTSTSLTRNIPVFNHKFDLDKYNSVNVMEKQANGQWKSVNKKVANIIIFGPDARLNHAETINFGGNGKSENGYGSLAELKFHPEYLTGFVANGKAHVADPAISFAHELVHCLHSLSGLISKGEFTLTKPGHSQVQQKIKTITSEEIVTFGGRDVASYNQKYQQANRQKSFESLQKVVDKLNKFNFIKYPELRDHFIKKYQAQEENNKISLSRDAFDRYYDLMKFAFTEVNIAKEFGVTTTNSYHELGDGIHDRRVIQSLLDDSVYTIEKGFVDGQLVTNPVLEEVKPEQQRVTFCTDASYNSKIITSCVVVENDELASVPGEKSFADTTIENTTIDHSTKVGPSLTQRYRDRIINDWQQSDADTNSISIDNEILSAATDAVSNTPGGKSVDDRTVITENYTSYHYLKASQFDASVDVKKNKINFSTDMESALENPKLVFTSFSKTAENINKQVSPINNVIGFSLYIKQIVADFTDESGQTTKFDIAADVLNIVPYVGPILGIAKSLSHNDFIGAVTNAGVVTLLFVAPELELPVLLALTIKGLIDEENIKKKARETVKNAIDHRREKYDEVYSFITAQWNYGIHWQLLSRIRQVQQHLDWQLATINANLAYHKAQYKGDMAELPEIEKMVSAASSRLAKAREQALNNTVTFIYQLSLRHLKTAMIPKALETLKNFDEQTRKNISDFLKQVSGVIGSEMLHELENEVAAAFSQQINYSMPDHLFEDELQKDITENQLDGQQKLVLQVDVDEKDTIRDFSGNNTIINSSVGVNIVDGRDGRAVRMQNDNGSVVIINNSALTFSETDAFTITFWLRIPKTSQKQTLGTAITLFSRGKTDYWRVCIKDGKLSWYLKGNTGNVSLDSAVISDNKWRFVVLKYDPDRTMAEMDIFVLSNYSYFRINKTTKNIGVIPGNDDIVLAVKNARSRDFFIRFEHWNMYARYLTAQDIEKRFNSYFNASEPRDFWGEKIRVERNYYLSHSPTLYYCNAVVQDDGYVISLEPLRKRKISLYGGSQFKFLNIVHNDPFVKHDEAYYIKSDDKYFFPVDAVNKPGYDKLRLLETPAPVEIKAAELSFEGAFLCSLKVKPVPQHTGGYLTTDTWRDNENLRYIYHDLYLAHEFNDFSPFEFYWALIPEDEGWVD